VLFRSKWHSFDKAFENLQSHEIGFPLRGLVEIYGQPMSGKTSLAVSLSAKIALSKDAKKASAISIADIEGTPTELFRTVLESAGYENGIVYLHNEGVDEDNLDEMLDDVESGLATVGILDSLGAVSPIAEVQGTLKDANMGRRALVAAKFSRRVLRHFREQGKEGDVIIFTNHVQQIIGGMGSTTPGGDAKKYACKVRIGIKRSNAIGKKKIEIPDNVGWMVEGTVAKNSNGVSGRTFSLFIIGGKGVHAGLTAVLDCVRYKLATFERTIKLGEESMGYLRDMLEEKYDFKPFYKALEAAPVDDTVLSEPEEEKQDE
jgi:recombination protein RecA